LEELGVKISERGMVEIDDRMSAMYQHMGNRGM
jgi:hypothetical protein